jgi:hypothetical protein
MHYVNTGFRADFGGECRVEAFPGSCLIDKAVLTRRGAPVFEARIRECLAPTTPLFDKVFHRRYNFGKPADMRILAAPIFASGRFFIRIAQPPNQQSTDYTDFAEKEA